MRENFIFRVLYSAMFNSGKRSQCTENLIVNYVSSNVLMEVMENNQCYFKDDKYTKIWEYETCTVNNIFTRETKSCVL